MNIKQLSFNGKLDGYYAIGLVDEVKFKTLLEQSEFNITAKELNKPFRADWAVTHHKDNNAISDCILLSNSSVTESFAITYLELK